MDQIIVALRAIVALAAVLGLLLWLSRRLQKGQAAGAAPRTGPKPRRLGALLSAAVAPRERRQAERITVVARTGLGGKAQLVVAEFDGIRYVLGVTEQGVSVVDTHEAPADETAPVAALVADAPTEPGVLGERRARRQAAA
ncbi:flagellar biosynthetic protein FliO [Microbacterium sp. ASV81]|uniref:Flagellar biosynthetic protein FliO n=1 Tax=Microbacterium capsulatum TaxID=3041921 RepID=A0ABU0XG95_9MICO|nr:flagellar biosynthetic protein FliO [Microbacterium sp. ASV81]MDQ4213210.1 flagellar biosynthetic protein FliO [Microbacterium sp. ASV81]